MYVHRVRPLCTYIYLYKDSAVDGSNLFRFLAIVITEKHIFVC